MDMTLGKKTKPLKYRGIDVFLFGFFKYIIVGLVEDTNIIYNLINNF